MAIVPIPLKNSRSVVDFFKQGGKVEIPRPEQCTFPDCLLKEPLRKNGTYPRWVIYWSIRFLVFIVRFRCRRCGKTASRPYGWLVPYCRFSAEVIAAGVEAYARSELTYWDVSIDLSDIELAEPEMDITKEESYEELVSSSPAEKAVEPRCRPVRSTVFYWVNLACTRIESLLTQMQKEVVQARKRGREEVVLPAESSVENPNSYKATADEKRRMLDRVSFATRAIDKLLKQGKQQWYRLRAYFLTAAESRNDLLTGIRLQMPITQSFELDFV